MQNNTSKINIDKLLDKCLPNEDSKDKNISEEKVTESILVQPNTGVAPIVVNIQLPTIINNINIRIGSGSSSSSRDDAEEKAWARFYRANS